MPTLPAVNSAGDSRPVAISGPNLAVVLTDLGRRSGGFEIWVRISPVSHDSLGHAGATQIDAIDPLARIREAITAQERAGSRQLRYEKRLSHSSTSPVTTTWDWPTTENHRSRAAATAQMGGGTPFTTSSPAHGSASN